MTPRVEIDGRDVQPVRFRRCRCGQPMDAELTPLGLRLVQQGFDPDVLARIAAESHMGRLT